MSHARNDPLYRTLDRIDDTSIFDLETFDPRALDPERVVLLGRVGKRNKVRAAKARQVRREGLATINANNRRRGLCP